MPRPLVFGNGALLINLDRDGNLRDLYWPRVGMHNHLIGYRIRFGVWTPSGFAWFDHPGWHRSLGMEDGTAVGHSIFVHHDLNLRVEIQEAVHPELPIYLRRFHITTMNGEPVEARLFSHHDLRIAETDIGDCAYVRTEGVFHFKWDHWFRFTGRSEHGGPHQMTTAIKEFQGAVGCGGDCEDGWLHPVPINQGSVDSAMAIHGSTVDWWLHVGRSEQDVMVPVPASSEEFLNQVREANRAWSARATPVSLPEPIRRLYHRSLHLIQTQCDRNGAVLAANDTDILQTNRATYSFCWPRDAALVVRVMDQAGYPEFAERYFAYCAPILKRDGIFQQKYDPAGHLGAGWHPRMVHGEAVLPIQLDESALTLWALGEHHRDYPANGTTRFWEDWGQALRRTSMDLLSANREPVPTWDLWEERRGIHAYTLATMVAALRSSSVWGEDHEPAIRRLTEIAREHLWDPELGCYRRMVGEGGLYDSSVMGLFLFGLIPWDDPTTRPALDRLEQALWIHDGIGGMARNSHDYYFRRTDHHPGNPWVICTLWMAQCRIALAQNQEELEETQKYLRWVVDRTESTGVLAEQYHPLTGEPLSVSPLTWSHAEFVGTVLAYEKRGRELGLTGFTETK